MKIPEVSKPHDSLVRYTFSMPENAISLLEGVLPAELKDEIVWEGLT